MSVGLRRTFFQSTASLAQKQGAVSGFTIVELLIVIAVIAVLAAISFVAYSGIQIRAKNASKLSVVRQLIKKLEVYKATHEEYLEPNPTEGVYYSSVVNVSEFLPLTPHPSASATQLSEFTNRTGIEVPISIHSIASLGLSCRGWFFHGDEVSLKGRATGLFVLKHAQ